LLDMILTCPSCGTQYVVKDGAIPPEGRQVRCAACKHSWHENPPAMDLTEEVQPAAEVEQAAIDESPAAEESIAEATLIEPRSGPEAEERAFEEAMIDEAGVTAQDAEFAKGAEPDVEPIAEPAPANWNDGAEMPVQDDDFTPFADFDDRPPRRSRLWAVLLLVGLIIAAAAAFWFLAPPEWKARVGLSEGGTSPLALVTTHMDRQQLESGNELLTVTGRVINPTSEVQNVPPLQAQLRSRTGKIVYSWTIAPPAPQLQAGASASFNSAEVNVPPGGDELTITLGAPRS
jgi:predicted Zn finger-like uncharacterized protein